MIALAAEDGFVENITALLFAISGIVFLWCAYTEHLNNKRKSYAVYFFAAWGILLIVFAGEEISWGQRILGFSTPARLNEINLQSEVNVHNIVYIDKTFGGAPRFLSMMMLSTGLLLPVAYQFGLVRSIVDRIGFPVPSVSCSILFVGAYLYGVYFATAIPRFDPDLQFEFLEVREMILSMATTCFAFETWRRIPRLSSRSDKLEAG
jgi:hypothetical protein